MIEMINMILVIAQTNAQPITKAAEASNGIITFDRVIYMIITGGLAWVIKSMIDINMANHNVAKGESQIKQDEMTKLVQGYRELQQKWEDNSKEETESIARLKEGQSKLEDEVRQLKSLLNDERIESQKQRSDLEDKLRSALKRSEELEERYLQAIAYARIQEAHRIHCEEQQEELLDRLRKLEDLVQFKVLKRLRRYENDVVEAGIISESEAAAISAEFAIITGHSLDTPTDSEFESTMMMLPDELEDDVEIIEIKPEET